MNKSIRYSSIYSNYLSLNNSFYLLYFIGLLFIIIFSFNPTSKTYCLINYFIIPLSIIYLVFSFTLLVIIYLKSLKRYKDFNYNDNTLFVDFTKFIKTYKLYFFIKLGILILFIPIFILLKYLVSIYNDLITITFILYLLFILVFSITNRFLTISNEKYTCFNNKVKDISQDDTLILNLTSLLLNESINKKNSQTFIIYIYLI